MSTDNEPKSIIQLPKNGTRLALVFFIINFLLVFANLYLSNGYVSKPTYEADIKERLRKDEKLNDTIYNFALDLRGIKDHMQGDEKQDARIQDHEVRLREVEHKR